MRRDLRNSVIAIVVITLVFGLAYPLIFTGVAQVLVFGAASGDWLPAGFDLMGQRGGDLGERMAAAFADAHVSAALPMLLIRADTLGVTPDMLADAARSLRFSLTKSD